MEVGKLYQFTSRRKEISMLLDNQGKKWKSLPLDTLIVPLEIHRTTINGSPLQGKTSRRLKALFSNGDIGTIYVSTEEWEEVGFLGNP